MLNVLNQLYTNSSEKPHKQAVYFNRSYSYNELTNLIDKAATFLIKNGYKENNPIPIYFDPSIEALVLVYAILKIGAYYVPFNSSQPVFLIQDLISDFSNDQIICSTKDLNLFKKSIGFDLSCLSDLEPSIEIKSGLYAYQLFTSGTTGRPKGVLLTTENLNYFTSAMDISFPCNSEDTLLWTTSWTFDVSIVQIFGFVINGGKLIIPSVNAKRALTEIPQYVQNHTVSHLNLVPTVLSGLLNIWNKSDLSILNNNLKYLLIAGEALKLELGIHIKNLLPDVKILNLYGPTETTVYATYYEVTGEESSSLPIGKPLENCEIAILSEDLKELAQGEIGEICIGGSGVGVGYVNNNVLTNSQFIQWNNKRYYRSGDYGRFNNNGDIEYFGRRDRQIKIFGTRIELSEIESKLSNFFSSPDQVRVVQDKTSLHVFYIGDIHLRKSLEDCLKAWLPIYAQPVSYNPMLEFPTNASGKLNEKALLQILEDSKSIKLKNNSKETDFVEEIVFKAFLINKDKIHTAFSDLGNDSLTTVMAIVQIESELKLTVPDTAVLGSATPADLISYLIAQDKQRKLSLLQSPEVSNDLNIDLTSTIETLQNLWKNLWHSQNDIGTAYEAHALQRLYYFDGFESALNLHMKFSDAYSIESIEKAILKIINDHQLLKSYFSIESEEELKFKTKNSSQILQIPKLKINSILNQTLLEKIILQLAGNDKKIISEQILHTPILLTTRNGTELIWTISHLLCDQSSIYFLKNEIVDELNGKNSNQNKKDNLFSSFVKFQKDNSSPENYSNSELTNILLELDLPNFYQIDPTDKIKHVALKSPGNVEIIGKIGDICFQIGKILADELNIEKFAISTIVNLRNFNRFDATEIVGDCHSTVVTPFVRSNDKTIFISEFNSIFDSFKTGGSPYFAAFSTFPRMSDLQKLLEKAYDTIPIVGVNYLGPINKNDFEDIHKNLLHAKKSLMNFPGKRIYVTVFEDPQGFVHAYFLTYPLIQ